MEAQSFHQNNCDIAVVKFYFSSQDAEFGTDLGNTDWSTQDKDQDLRHQPRQKSSFSQGPSAIAQNRSVRVSSTCESVPSFVKPSSPRCVRFAILNRCQADLGLFTVRY